MVKKTKIIIAVIAVVVLCASCSIGTIIYRQIKGKGGSGSLTKIGGYKADEITQIKDFSAVTDGQELILMGKIAGLAFNSQDSKTYSLEMADYVTLFIESNLSTELKKDDFVIVEGTWISTSYTLKATKITKITQEDYEDMQKANMPQLKIEIIDYPTALNHSCAKTFFKLKLTNIGNIPIDHSKIYDYEYGYGFYYFVDGEYSKSYSYDESRGEIAHLGLKDFGVLNPGDSKEVEFGGGGHVVQTLYKDYYYDDGRRRELGGSGEGNLLQNKGIGEHQVHFGWAKDRGDLSAPDKPMFLYETEPVKISLSKDECDMTDIHQTVISEF